MVGDRGDVEVADVEVGGGVDRQVVALAVGGVPRADGQEDRPGAEDEVQPAAQAAPPGQLPEFQVGDQRVVVLDDVPLALAGDGHHDRVGERQLRNQFDREPEEPVVPALRKLEFPETLQHAPPVVQVVLLAGLELLVRLVRSLLGQPEPDDLRERVPFGPQALAGQLGARERGPQQCAERLGHEEAVLELQQPGDRFARRVGDAEVVVLLHGWNLRSNENSIDTDLCSVRWSGVYSSVARRRTAAGPAARRLPVRRRR
ncbi:hypothetical protein [Amycolatopsis eburnea]|uniref:Uncharacterized protein n=1 Tax=Amycolatopsis eburnea TaxID=2267691 RepID=A0A427SU36_9PSEU|nr:hypothetical protein [Amycolatopsis eburnea]RSD07251.1 hypothetical protein EIY87_46190 [Amycolatopsis eburnea]